MSLRHGTELTSPSYRKLFKGKVPANIVNARHGTGRNPLLGRTRDRLVADAYDYYREFGLRDLVSEDDWIKGVLYFRDPQGFPKEVGQNLHIPCSNGSDATLTVTYPDLRALERYEEKDRWQKWKNLSLTHKSLLATCSLAAITQGWDQSSMNATNLGWPSSLGLRIPPNIEEAQVTGDIWLFGFINGAPFLLGSIIGFLFTDPLSNGSGLLRFLRFGRRHVLFLAGIFSFSAMLGSAFVQSWRQLLICRLLLGVGMGSKATIVPILLSETAPWDIRGMIVSTWQVFDSFGIFLGFVAALAVSKFDQDHAWRYMFATATIPAFLLFFMVPFCVESPRWLLKHGRVKDALSALLGLHGMPSSMIACGDLLYIHESLSEETQWLLDRAGKTGRRSSRSIPLVEINRSSIEGSQRPSGEKHENAIHSLPSATFTAKSSGSRSKIAYLQTSKPAPWKTRWSTMLATQRMRT